MRARTKQEIMRGYATLRDDKARKKRRPFQILAVVLVLGGAGKLILTYHEQITTVASLVKNKLIQWSDDIRDPKNYSANPPNAPAPLLTPPTLPATQDVPTAPAAPSAPDDTLIPIPAPPPAPIMTPPIKPRPLAKNSWRVSGTVYDLATLAPTPGATITFELEGTPPARAITNENGEYEVDVLKKDGWTVSLDAANMRKGQLLDLDPAYRIRDIDERRAAFEQIAAEDLIPASVQWKKTSSKVRLNLIAVPGSWTDAPQR